jgi:CheY-like chemotaxis protein
MLKGKTILVVDDYDLIVERLTALLRELDGVGDVLAARSYAETVGMLGRRRLDIVLLDIHLPDRSGIELLDFIKSYYPAIRVIVISNQNNPHYRALCLDKGADYFIDKSNDFELLPGIINSFQGCSETTTGFLEH